MWSTLSVSYICSKSSSGSLHFLTAIFSPLLRLAVLVATICLGINDFRGHVFIITYYIFTTENQCIEASHVHVALLKRRKFRQIAQSKQHVLPGLAVAVAVGLGQAVVLLCEDLTADMLSRLTYLRYMPQRS